MKYYLVEILQKAIRAFYVVRYGCDSAGKSILELNKKTKFICCYNRNVNVYGEKLINLDYFWVNIVIFSYPMGLGRII